MSNKAGKMEPGTINTKVKELLKNGPITVRLAELQKVQQERLNSHQSKKVFAYRLNYNAQNMSNEAINTEAKTLLKNPPITLRLTELNNPDIGAAKKTPTRV